MKSTFTTSQCTSDRFIVRGQQRSSLHSNIPPDTIQSKNIDSIILCQNRTNEMIEMIELMSNNDNSDDDDDDVIDVCKSQDHNIQFREVKIQELSNFVTKPTTTTAATTTTINTITQPTNQPNLDLNITDSNEVPDTIQSSFILDDSNRSEPNGTTNMDTQKFHNNEAMEEQQVQQTNQEQNQKEHDNVQANEARRSCRKRCSPHEAAELRRLCIRLELKSGYKPSIEEVEEKYQLQLKKMEEEKNNNKKRKIDNTRKKIQCDVALDTQKIAWENMYKTLVEYINNKKSSSNNEMEISKDGSSTIIPSIWDGNVPQDFITNDGKRLGQWIFAQRRAKHDGTLSPELEQRLSSIGFKWRRFEVIPWDDMFESLQKYVTYQRNTINKDWSGRVPGDYRTDDNPPRSLGSWVRMQHYALTKNKLCNEYIQKLNSLNFHWIITTRKIWNSHATQRATKIGNNKNHDKNNNISSASTTTRKEDNSSPVKCVIGLLKTQNAALWENMYKILVEYINNQKRCSANEMDCNPSTIPLTWDGNVPTDFITNDGIRLGIWIKKQRHLKHKGILKPEHEQRLSSVGLKWRKYPIIPWDDMFDSLQKYVMYKKNTINKDWSGHVPCNYRTDDNPPRLLGSWVRIQHLAFTKNKLCNDYIQKLNSLDFQWIIETRTIRNNNDARTTKESNKNDEDCDINILNENNTSSKQLQQQQQQQQQGSNDMLTNQINLDLNITDSINKVPNAIQSSFVLDDSSNRSEPDATTNVDTQKCHNEVDEQHYQQIMENTKKRKTKLPMSDTNKKGNIHNAKSKKRCTIDIRNNNPQKNSLTKTTDECRRRNNIVSNITRSNSTRGNIRSPVKKNTLYTRRWDKMYGALIEYINDQKGRSCNKMEISTGERSTLPWIWDGHVPDHIITNDGKRLGTWIIKQRRSKISGTLNPEREQRLSSIGLKWRIFIPWDNMFESLQNYIINKRNTINKDWSGRVPCSYRTDDNPPRRLGKWVRLQHLKFTKNKLCNEYINKLNSLGFQWISDLCPRKWEKMYNALIEYINIQKRRSCNEMEIFTGKGSTVPWIWDGNVPHDFITNNGLRLGGWISHQRTAKRKGILNPEREQRLSSIGFKWSFRQLIPWDDMFESLQKYITNKRNTIKKDWSGRVPYSYLTDDILPRRLGEWVRVQHLRFTKNKLCNEYINKLNSLGFQWKRTKMIKQADSIIKNATVTIQPEELNSKKQFEQSVQLYNHGMQYLQSSKYYSASIAFGNSGNILKLLILKSIHLKHFNEHGQNIIISNNEHHGKDYDNLSIHHKNIVVNNDNHNDDGTQMYNNNNLRNLVEKYAQSYYKKAMCCYNDKNYLQTIMACNKILIVTKNVDIPSSSQSYQNPTITKMEYGDEELPNDILKMIPTSMQADALCQRAKANLRINLPHWKTDYDDDDIDDVRTDEMKGVDYFDKISSTTIFEIILNHSIDDDSISINRDMEAAALLGSNDAILWCKELVSNGSAV